jgi:hypothetical protein
MTNIANNNASQRSRTGAPRSTHRVNRGTHASEVINAAKIARPSTSGFASERIGGNFKL